MHEMGEGYMVNAAHLGVRDSVLEEAIEDHRAKLYAVRQRQLAVMMAEMLLSSEGEVICPEPKWAEQ